MSDGSTNMSFHDEKVGWTLHTFTPIRTGDQGNERADVLANLGKGPGPYSKAQSILTYVETDPKA